MGLTANEHDQFAERGWVGPFPLLTVAEAHAVDGVWQRNRTAFTYPETFGTPGLFAGRPWFKAMAAYLPEVFGIARMPGLTGRIASILGPDLLAWGVTVIEKRPGDRHPWHIDIEHYAWPGVSAFLGLRNTGPAATLDVISGSHRLERFPLAIGWGGGETALAAAREQGPACMLERVPVREGEFFLFDGRLWHGSRNESAQDRRAMILQYSAPRHRVATPLTFHPPVRWHPEPPPCVLALGAGDGPNRVIDAPLPLPARHG